MYEIFKKKNHPILTHLFEEIIVWSLLIEKKLPLNKEPSSGSVNVFWTEKGFFFKHKCVCLYEVYPALRYKLDIYLDEKEPVNFLTKGNWKFYWGGLLGKIEWILN